MRSFQNRTPVSKTTLKEFLCQLSGDLLEKRVIAKLRDTYHGGDRAGKKGPLIADRPSIDSYVHKWLDFATLPCYVYLLSTCTV